MAAVPLDSARWQLARPPSGSTRAMHFGSVVARWKVDVFRCRGGGSVIIFGGSVFRQDNLSQLLPVPLRRTAWPSQPDGRSLITSIGMQESAIWIHDDRGDRALSSEGYVASMGFTSQVTNYLSNCIREIFIGWQVPLLSHAA